MPSNVMFTNDTASFVQGSQEGTGSDPFLKKLKKMVIFNEEKIVRLTSNKYYFATKY